MRTLPIVLVAACATTLAVIFLIATHSTGTPPVVAVPDPVAAQPSAPKNDPAREIEPKVEPVPEASHERETAPSAPTTTGPTTAPKSQASRAHVFGRLIDSEQKPAAEVDLQLMSSGGEWVAGETIPTLQIRTWKIPGFTAKSGADGRFEFDVPVPTSDWISLHTQAPPYLGIVGKDFGPAGGREKPRIVAGDNDVGDLVLTITGAVEGDVRAIDGSAIAQAEVTLDGVFPGGFSINTIGDAAGHFVLGHVPPGTWSIGAKAEGFLSSSTPGVEVRARNTTPILAFRLERAPTIAGRVVDENDQPLEKMWIWGWPKSSGQGAGAWSKADGRFVIYLPQNEPYTLELEERSNHGKFERWGGFGSDKVFDPGTTDLVVKLVHAARTTFVVVEAKSNAVIEDYAITTVAKPDENGNVYRSDSSRQSKPAHHEHGECELAAKAGRDRVQVVAAGYVDLELDVAYDDGSDARQTLRMVPGATLTGRVMLAGAPVANPKLTLGRGSIKIDPSLPDAEDRMFDDNYTTDLDDFLGRLRNSDGRADGSFRITDLPAGTYELTVTGGQGAPKVVDNLRIEAGATLDLGEIVLDESGGLHGRVTIGVGQEQIDIGLRLDDSWGREHSLSGTDRSFTFENLSVGNHVLHTSMSGMNFRDELETPFAVAAGKTTELVVDLSAKAPCKAQIHVTQHGRPMRAVDVGWETIIEGRANLTGNLGTTGEQGVAIGTLPGGSAVVFVAKADNGLVIGRSAAPVHLGAGTLHEEELEIKTGELVLELPATMEVPEDGMLNVMLRTGDDFQMVGLGTPKSQFHMNKLRWTGRHCVIGPVRPGEYELMINAQKLVDKAFEGMMEPFKATITVIEDKTVTVEVKP